MLEHKLNNDMKISNDMKQLLHDYVKEEFNKFISENKEKIYQMFLCKPDLVIKKDNKALEKLFKLSEKKPKNFSSKKEYIKWLEQVG